MKKKIVLVSPAFPYRGGQALVEAYLFHTLSGLGYDCHTVSFTSLYPKAFFPGKTQYEESGFVAFPHADRIERRIHSLNPLSWIRTAFRIAAMKPDGVVFVWWMPFFGPAYWSIIRMLRMLAKTRIVFLMENYVSHENRWFDKLSAFLTVRLADAFICQSLFVRRQLTDAFAKKPVYQTTLSIYDCYDLKAYDEAGARRHLKLGDGPVILFFGLIRPYKGLDRLIRAFPRILSGHPGATLLVAGECYEPFEKYEALIRETGVPERISLHLKYIPNEAVEPYFKAADVVCLPYYSATQSGIVMLAYGFRKPVVVTDTGGLAELVREGKTGTVIADNDPGRIAEGVGRILDGDAAAYRDAIQAFVDELGYRNLEAAFGEILSEA